MPARRRASYSPIRSTACLACHTDQAEQFKKAHLHQPAFQQGCATCHEPHGSDNAHLLRAKTTNALCLECHGPDSKPQVLESEHMITIFNGSVKLPEDYFVKNKVVILPLKYGKDIRWTDIPHPTSWIRPTLRKSTPRSIALPVTSRTLRHSPTCW